MRHADVAYFGDPEARVDPDQVVLTQAGLEQARAAGRTLRDVRFDRVVTSGLPRTIRTAELVVEQLAHAPADTVLHQDADLQELRPGDWDAVRDEDVEASFLTAWSGVPPSDAAFLGGETIGSLVDRVGAAMARIHADPGWDTLLLVAHGGRTARSCPPRWRGRAASSGISSSRRPASTSSTPGGTSWCAPSTSRPTTSCTRGRARRRSSGCSSSTSTTGAGAVGMRLARPPRRRVRRISRTRRSTRARGRLPEMHGNRPRAPAGARTVQERRPHVVLDRAAAAPARAAAERGSRCRARAGARRCRTSRGVGRADLDLQPAPTQQPRQLGGEVRVTARAVVDDDLHGSMPRTLTPATPSRGARAPARAEAERRGRHAPRAPWPVAAVRPGGAAGSATGDDADMDFEPPASRAARRA